MRGTYVRCENVFLHEGCAGLPGALEGCARETSSHLLEGSVAQIVPLERSAAKSTIVARGDRLPASIKLRLSFRVYDLYTRYTIRIRVTIHLNFITILQAEA